MTLSLLSQRIRKVAQEFVADDVMTLAAALAFYTALSLSPLLLIFLWLAAFMGESAQAALISHIVDLVGRDAGAVINTIVENAEDQPSLASIAGVVSLVTLLVSASGAFGQLQHSLNVIWHVQTQSSSSILSWLKKRLLSAGMVFSVGFLMIVSLITSALLSAFIGYFEDGVPETVPLLQISHTLAAILLFTLLFALLFRFLPDASVRKKQRIWLGAFVTSLLFNLGKYLIGLYLGQSSIGSAFGAAGSLIILLAWVYYSSVIFFLGAEIAKVWSRH